MSRKGVRASSSSDYNARLESDAPHNASGVNLSSSVIPEFINSYRPACLFQTETVLAAIREWRVGATKCECNIVVEDT